MLEKGVETLALFVAFGALAYFWKPFRGWPVFYAVAYVVFTDLRAASPLLGIATQYHYVIAVEKLPGAIPSVWLQNHFYITGRIGVLDVATSLVYASYFVALHVVAILLLFKRRDLFAVFAAAILLTVYAGTAINAFVPTAPPWLAAVHGDIPAVHRVFEEVLDHINPNLYATGLKIAGDNAAGAMPSEHFGVTLIIALFAWRFINRRLGILGLIYAASMGFSLIYLGEHYLADVLAGLVLAIVAWIITLRIFRTNPTVPEQKILTRLVSTH